jgi:sulfur-carrier protein adenylyltransferase/sulfurtransferase
VLSDPHLPELTPDERQRYARHLILEQVGPEGQRRLKAGRVLLVGAGGLGSPAAMYLAAAGVGTLGIAEFDVVDASNLQRQVIHGTSDVGRPKLDSARDRLREINPRVQVEPHPLRFTSENALDVVGAYDVVLDGSDNFPTRYLVNDACVLTGSPYVYGSILRFEGQASVFGAEGGPCYRCIFAEPPPPDLIPGCAEAGVLGALPGIVGTIQALEAIKLILGIGETLAGRLLLLDALGMRFREIAIPRDPGCSVCGDAPTVTALIDYERFCGMENDMQPPAVPEITASELDRRLKAGDAITLIDVREPREWEIGNLGRQGARLIPLGEIAERHEEIDPEGEVVVYCRSGARSEQAASYLLSQGYRRVANLKGGVLAWSDEVDPSMPKY